MIRTSIFHKRGSFEIDNLTTERIINEAIFGDTSEAEEIEAIAHTGAS